MNNLKIGIIGLGYVGLPLAVEFAKKFPVIGYDINKKRVSDINQNVDTTLEIDYNTLDAVNSVKKNNLTEKKGFVATSNVSDLKSCNFYIVTVPTPVDKFKKPILIPLIKASESVAKLLDKNNFVIYAD